MNISQHIKQLRLNSGLTQQKMSNKTGISREIISYMESGKQKVSLEQLKSICEACGIKLWEFLKMIE